MVIASSILAKGLDHFVIHELDSCSNRRVFVRDLLVQIGQFQALTILLILKMKCRSLSNVDELVLIVLKVLIHVV